MSLSGLCSPLRPSRPPAAPPSCPTAEDIYKLGRTLIDAAQRAQWFRAGHCPQCIRSAHTVASRALLAGESVDEIAFLLGHRDANATRAVSVRKVADARRRSMRRSRMVAEFGGALRVALAPGDEADYHT